MDLDTVSALNRLAPELMHKVHERAMVLERIAVLQPIGRRALSQKLELSEREVRAICDSLKADGLIDAGASGMTITAKSLDLIEPAREFERGARGIAQLERSLALALSSDAVAVVPGDADQDAGVLQELGRVAAVRLMRMLKDGMILAVSGGGTVAAAANALPGGARMDIDVLPARGGMGASVEIQADTLAAELARKLGGRYALLHLPDSITPGALEELKRLPEIGEPLNAMRRADLMLHGIGRADVMARNRHLPESDIRRILEQGAVAEALGAYFDLSGNLVHQASGIGVLGGQLGAIPAIVALAAGRGKAEAILAVARHHRHSLIITDEGAGREILNLLRI